MNDEMHFKNFLGLCQENNITVWADPDLMRDKGTRGHWNGNNQLSVHRPDQKLSEVRPDSPPERIASFVGQSPNVRLEMAILLHEFGHWFFKHAHSANVASVLSYRYEVEAWNKGEEIGRKAGIQDFSIFHAERDEALRGYRVALKIEGLL